MIPFALAIHTIAAVIWVGGIFFLLVVLRPASASLGDMTRLTLWRAVLDRFFHWVWQCIALLLITGYGVVFFGYDGFASVGLHVHIMQLTGLMMVALFVLLWTRPWQEFCHALDRGDTPAATRALGRLRGFALANLLLGFFTTVLGAIGAFLSY
ncbi:copper resistance protein D [mine drainage metagenome]|uniref:Copper resistance protein D n=1 Tax=mine drainage metagenome TaxID=410659 RepID=A0A1J5RLV2_9ZZZZ